MDSGAFAARQRDLGSSVHEILLDRGHVRIGVVASCAIAWYAVPSTTSSAKLLIAIAPTFFFSIVPPESGPSRPIGFASFLDLHLSKNWGTFGLVRSFLAVLSPPLSCFSRASQTGALRPAPDM